MRIVRAATLFAALALVAAASGATSSLQQTAERGYIFGFPMVDFYRIMYGYSIDTKSPSYTAPFNVMYNNARVYTPADRTIQTPNSDTPYSILGLDLRAEPIVLTLPKIPDNRYYSVQLVDLYTFNIAYLGSRTTGNGGGTFLLAGPNWHGTAPAGVAKTIRFDTQIGLALIRTQLFGPNDLNDVKKIQAGYKAEPLSKFEGKPAPPKAPSINWITPLTTEQERTSPQFFNVLAFVLQFCPPAPEDAGIRNALKAVGVVPGEAFDAGSRGDVIKAGMAAGQKQIDAKRATNPSSADIFGTRAQLHDDYLLRAVGTQSGILGNSAAEALYGGYDKDANGRPLTGAKRYSITFAKGELPPVHAFWSLTMYDLPEQLLVKNPIDRYLINSPMLPSLKRNPDGGIALYIQHAEPPAGERANWLPAPSGPFFMVLRLYWPKEAALSGQWKQPPARVQP